MKWRRGWKKERGFREALNSSEEGIVLLVGSLSWGFRNHGEGWVI